MIIQFNDKHMTLKHLCFIIEAKKVDTTILRIRESFTKNTISEDLLFYPNEASLTKDLKKLRKALDEYTRYVNDMQKQQKIGFQSMIGAEDGEGMPEDGCGDDCE